MANQLKNSIRYKGNKYTSRKKISWKQSIRKHDNKPIGKTVLAKLHNPKYSFYKSPFIGL